MYRRWILLPLLTSLIALGIAGWLWSASNLGQFCAKYHTRAMVCGTNWGVVYLGTGRTANSDWPTGVFPRDPPPRLLPDGSTLLGFSLNRSPDNANWFINVPYWFLIGLFSLLLVLVWRKTRPHKPRQAFPIEAKAAGPP